METIQALARSEVMPLARPQKDGVDYFPLDVDFLQDDKIRLIKAEFGSKGILILIALLCDIYRTTGYYKVWDKDACFLMADAVGCGVVPENITQVVHGCLRRSIFNDGVFQMFGILTSAGIQRRYIRAVSTRDQITFYKEYWLLDLHDKKDVPASALNKVALKTVNLKKTRQSLKETPVYLQSYPQRKGKQRKGEERKVQEQGTAACAPLQSTILTILLHDKTEYPIAEQQVKEWEVLYPAVDILQELKKMKGWCEANPAKRKTDRGILRFVHAWLARAQDRGGTGYAGQQALGNGKVRQGTTAAQDEPAPPGQYGQYL